MSTGAPPSPRWLFGPMPDLLVGCGVLYMASVVFFSFGGASLRPVQPEWVFPFLVLLVSLPHYGATLVRAYERREDRTQYRVAAVGVTLAIVAATVLSLHWTALGCAMVGLFLTWSPWHYAGQNFGISMMFLGRAGVPVAGWVRRAFRASFFLSFLLVALIMHEAGGAADTIVREVGLPAIRFVPLGIPTGVAQSLFAVTLALYVVSLVVAGTGLLRAGSVRAILPAAVLVGSQALWFSVPAGLRLLGGSGVEPLDWSLRTYYFMWIALAHAAQYLWITSYFARASGSWTGFGPYFAKTCAAGTAIFLVPVLLFSPDVLGTVSYDNGLIVLVTAAGNLHHFVLDGMIWKLRSRRVGDVLVRSASGDAVTPFDARKPRRLLRYAIWGTCAAAVAVKAFAIWQTDVLFPSAVASGDLVAAEATLDRLAWIGHDVGARRLELASRLERQDPARSLDQYGRSIELRPTAAAYAGTGRLLAQAGNAQGALEAFEAGLALAPGHVRLLRAAGNAHLRAGDPARGRELLEAAAGRGATAESESDETLPRY